LKFFKEDGMACKKYLEMAVEEIDGELEDSRSLLLMRHLVSCESCRMRYESHLRLCDIMRKEAAGDYIAVPESFSSSVMAGIERDIPQTVKIPDYGTSPAYAIISSLRSISFSPASLYPIAALSALLIVVIAGLRYEKTGSSDTAGLPLANARVIKAESMDKKVLKAEVDKADLSYYLSRHEAKAYRSSGKSISRNSNLIYTSYNAGNR